MAAYRIAVERWTFKDAVDEMIRYKCSPKIYRHCLSVLRTLENADWRSTLPVGNVAVEWHSEPQIASMGATPIAVGARCP